MKAPTSDDSPAALSSQVFDENGVDITLVRYTLGLTPNERLKAVENFMRVMATVRRPAAPATVKVG